MSPIKLFFVDVMRLSWCPVSRCSPSEGAERSAAKIMGDLGNMATERKIRQEMWF